MPPPTSRREFLKIGAAAALMGGRVVPVCAAADPSRIALVVGNNSYRDAPLVNAVNDAKAVGALMEQAGLTVTLKTDLNREALHSAADLPEQCLDLGVLLAELSRAKGKTFVLILDARRDNPFGESYRLAQKGLSQFDAPVGSLLAFSTAPGSVAADGSGANGLYTGNLVRELSVKGVRLEDALKRVRLNVRLASRGAQVPWESTSLESDVFLFNDAPRLTEDELEQQIEADVAQWINIKSSRKADDWVAYLRNFPNGRFAEIAQVRLTRLLADAEAGIPTIRNEAEYDALPKGATYVDPKGNLRRKP